MNSFENSSTSGRPPRPKPPSSASRTASRSGSGSGSGSKKSQSRNSSDSPSNNACNDVGKAQLNKRWRSVLSHPLGISLLCRMYDTTIPSEVTNENDSDSSDKEVELDVDENRDDILASAVDKWKKEKQAKEPFLTKEICKNIVEKKIGLFAEKEVCAYNKGVEGEHHGKMDIVIFSDEKASENKETPLAVVEVGTENELWWQKLDQNRMYLDYMLSYNTNVNQMKFTRPMIFGVLTVDKKYQEEDGTFEFKFGIFLCVPKEEKDGAKVFRMILIWNHLSKNRLESSRLFGRFLRVVSWFSKKVDQKYEYNYLSSNCCTFGKNKVLRIYDGRFRKTYRSPAIYLDPNCQEVTGKVKIIFRLSRDSNNNGDTDDKGNGKGNSNNDDTVGFWSPSTVSTPEKDFVNSHHGERDLLIIAVPYKNGCHQASKFQDFVPIIEQIEHLHKHGYVHGDIRAFNIVFEDHKQNGKSQPGLIDFDLGGKAREAKYPPGYNSMLDDGNRLGKEGKPLEKCHDWYAVTKLIFSIYEKEDLREDTPAYVYRRSNMWNNFKWGEKKNLEEHVRQLIEDLQTFDKHFSIVPGEALVGQLKLCQKTYAPTKTHHGGGIATGSPPKNSKNLEEEDKPYLIA